MTTPPDIVVKNPDDSGAYIRVEYLGEFFKILAPGEEMNVPLHGMYWNTVVDVEQVKESDYLADKKRLEEEKQWESE